MKENPKNVIWIQHIYAFGGLSMPSVMLVLPEH